MRSCSHRLASFHLPIEHQFVEHQEVLIDRSISLPHCTPEFRCTRKRTDSRPLLEPSTAQLPPISGRFRDEIPSRAVKFTCSARQKPLPLLLPVLDFPQICASLSPDCCSCLSRQPAYKPVGVYFLAKAAKRAKTEFPVILPGSAFRSLRHLQAEEHSQ